MPGTSTDTHMHTNTHTHTHGYTQIHSGQTHKTASTSHNTVGVNLRSIMSPLQSSQWTSHREAAQQGSAAPERRKLSVAVFHHVSPLVTITHDMKPLSHTTELQTLID